MSQRAHAVRRVSGISLVEVIFAIGVILIGLVGVMSILPLAGRRAQDAITLSVGAAMGDAVSNQLLSKQWLNWSMPGQSQYRIRTVAGGLTEQVTIVPMAGINRPYEYSLHREAFCIDPMMVRQSTETSAVGSFNSMYFPYYQPGYNPDRNPADNLSGSTAVADNLPHLPAPLRRMVRVGVLRHRGVAQLLTDAEAFQLAERVDDLRIERPEDRTLPALIKGSSATSATAGLPYGARFASGEYSWMATVVPEPTSGYATLSVVTLRNRDRQFDFPDVGEESPDANAQSERLTAVQTNIGFNGGAGGTVTIRGSLNVSPRVEVGNWVMMSSFLVGIASPSYQYQSYYSPTAVPNQFPIHRWYRVAAVDAEPTINYSTGTWTRALHLDGPDWQFDARTYLTIVDGAVSVTSNTVRLNAL